MELYIFLVLLINGIINVDICEAVAPVISNLPGSVNLAEDSTGEVLQFTIAVTDADGTFVCDLGTGSTPGTANTKFRVRTITSATTWGIYTVSGETFDFATQSSYSLDVECTDGDGALDEGVFTVNIAQNSVPVITNIPTGTTASAATTSVIGTTVFSVTSTDTENDVLYYSIVCNPVSCPFTIFDSGTMVLDQDISTTTVASYTVTVTVSDSHGSGIAKTFTVTITGINDTPSITNLGSSISILENSALGAVLETTACTDGDTVTYTMTCTPTSGLTYFSIDSSSGQISTSANTLINYETLAAASTTSFACVVTCSDGQASDTATVSFAVTNENEAPSFAQASFSVSADEGAAGTALQTSGYVITDEDVGDTTTFSHDCGTTALTSYFSIDISTGIFSYGAAYDADDATRPSSVSCSVTVTDSAGLTDVATLNIVINNINDNVPLFPLTAYTFFISDGSVVSTTVGDVTATDDDIGVYGVLTYSLDQTSLPSEYFGISENGRIYVDESISTLVAGSVTTFDAIATDIGGLQGTTTVSVIVTATTTASTTTTTIRYLTFFDDTRSIVWLTVCCACAAAIFAVGMFMFFYYGVYKYLTCLRCEKLPRRKKVYRPRREPEVIEEIPARTPSPKPTINYKPSPDRDVFDFWTAKQD